MRNITHSQQKTNYSQSTRGITDASRLNPCGICGATKPKCGYSTAYENWLCYRCGSGGGLKEEVDASGDTYWVLSTNTEQLDQERLFRSSSIVSADTLHSVYSAMNAWLPLTKEQEKHLFERGFTRDELDLLAYAGLPPPNKRRDIRDDLQRQFGGQTLLGVPGFYLEQVNNKSMVYLGGYEGILVPVRNSQGQIVLQQTRRMGEVKPKWFILSCKNGVTGSPQVHVPSVGMRWNDGNETVIIEGPLKADYVKLRTGVHAVGCIGVDQWSSALEFMRKERTTGAVSISWDMDYWAHKSTGKKGNPKILQTLYNLAINLLRDGREVVVWDWNDKYQANIDCKGIDDLIRHGKYDSLKKHSNNDAIAYIKRCAHECGLTLKEATHIPSETALNREIDTTKHSGSIRHGDSSGLSSKAAKQLAIRSGTLSPDELPGKKHVEMIRSVTTAQTELPKNIVDDSETEQQDNAKEAKPKRQRKQAPETPCELASEYEWIRTNGATAVSKDENSRRIIELLAQRLVGNESNTKEEYKRELTKRGYEHADTLYRLVVDKAKEIHHKQQAEKVHNAKKHGHTVFDRGDETELASQLYQDLGSNIQHDRGEFWRYSEKLGIWEVIDSHTLTMKIMGYAGSYTGPSLAPLKVGNHMVKGTIALLKELCGHTRKFFDNALPGVAFRDYFVTVDKRTHQIVKLPHSQENRATYALDLDYTDIPHTPKIDKFLSEVWNDLSPHEFTEQVELFKEWLGAAVMGVAYKHEKALFLLGNLKDQSKNGSNGKSATIKGLILPLFRGSDCSSVPPREWGRSFSMVPMARARLNFVTELTGEEFVTSDRFKQTTSGELQTYERKFHDAETIRYTCAQLFAGNETIETKDRSHGFWRRCLVIAYNRVFTSTEARVDIAQELQTELAQWASLVIQAYARLQARGHYTKSVATERNMLVIRRESTPERLFLDEYFNDLLMFEKGRVSGKKLYSAYTQWCRDNGHKAFSSTKFGRNIKEWLESVASNGVFYVGWKTEETEGLHNPSANPSVTLPVNLQGLEGLEGLEGLNQLTHEGQKEKCTSQGQTEDFVDVDL